MIERAVLGVGLRPDADLLALRETLGECLGQLDGEVAVVAVATLDRRAGHPAVRALADAVGVEPIGVSAEVLAGYPAPNPSPRVAEAVGTPSVAEAAVLALGGDLLAPKTVGRGVTMAIGRLPDLRHHGDREAGPGLVDLAVNVRGGGPPEWLRSRLAAALGELGSYPDATAATAAVAARHGRAPAEVLLTAGAAEAFVLIARALTPQRAVVVHPQFTEPEAALRAAGHPVVRALLPPPFTFDPGRVPDDADLVMIGNPTNPTSVLHPADAIAGLARPGRVLVVDEAFMDAVPGEPESLAGRRTPGLPGLIVVRSLTKTWALPGLRVGYVVGDPAVIARLAAAQPLWSAGTLALVAAQAVVEPAALAEAEARAHDLGRRREHLLARLAPLSGVEVVPDPRAPFLLLRGPAGVHQRLRSAGWATRRADTFPGLGPGWLRIAVREPEVADAFVAALDKALTDVEEP